MRCDVDRARSKETNVSRIGRRPHGAQHLALWRLERNTNCVPAADHVPQAHLSSEGSLVSSLSTAANMLTKDNRGYCLVCGLLIHVHTPRIRSRSIYPA